MAQHLTAIEEYYETVKGEYNIPFEHFKIICNSPFKFLRNIISSGILKNIRFQYLGCFEVSPSRVKYCKKTLEENFEKGLISERRYKERIKVYDNYKI